MLNLATVAGRPWAIDVRTAENVRRIVDAHGIIGLRQLAEIRADIRERTAAAGPGARSAGGVLVLRVVGLMTQRGGTVDSAPTASSAALAEEVRAAAANQAVSAMVLEWDSPGGEVYGVAELAQVIREARAAKPIVSHANSLAASAAYWAAAQASEVMVTPSGEIGSVGVYALHQDASKAAESEGVKYTYISAGKYKTEGHPYEPLGEEALAAMQANVDRYHAMFVSDLAKGRHVSVEHVRDGFGQGRVVGAKAAVEAGMADSVGTLDDAIRRAAGLARERSRGMAALAQAQARKVALG